MDRRTMTVHRSFVWLTAWLFACAGRVPVPPAAPAGADLAPHSGEQPAIVPYPPPPARVEFLPPRPAKESLWLDGHWEWSGRDFAWSRGRWALPPAPGAYYAPAASVRRSNGQLFYYVGRWHLGDGTPVAASGER